MQGLNSTNNQVHNLANNLPATSKIIKYRGDTVLKIIKAMHKLYIADRPEDSYIKKHAKYAGRTFFSVAKTIGRSYLALGAPTLSIAAGLITNYCITGNEEVYKNTNNLIYFGVAGLATTITFSFCEVLNQIREYYAPELDYIIASDNYAAASNHYTNSVNQMRELYDEQRELYDEQRELYDEQRELYDVQIVIFLHLLDIIGENDSLLDQLSPEILRIREAKILAYDQLKQYEGDTLNPDETLAAISLAPLKDINQPVIFNKQVYEYANLANWYKIAECCPCTKGELNWQNVFRINNNK